MLETCIGLVLVELPIELHQLPKKVPVLEMTVTCKGWAEVVHDEETLTLKLGDLNKMSFQTDNQIRSNFAIDAPTASSDPSLSEINRTDRQV